MKLEDKYHTNAVLKFAGGFIAWMIGSGFATGQEIFQFFSSYGYLSYVVIFLNLLGFAFVGHVLFITGYEHRNDHDFNQFKYFCGEKLGTFYSWVVLFTLVLIMPVLISGAGATLSEYYGVDHRIGSLVMAIMVLCSYLIGFEKLVKVVSTIGPIIIIFIIVVGAITVVRDMGNFHEVAKYEPLLRQSVPTSSWVLSSALYVSLCFLSGSTYFTELGSTAKLRNDAKYGSLLGAMALILTIAMINTAILLNAGDLSHLAIPILYLGKKISLFFGGIFSIVLILGMFSSCSAMMWSVCSRFDRGGKLGNRIFALSISMLTYTLGLFSFSKLIGVFYPMVGYLGLLYIGCVVYKGISRTIRTETCAYSKDKP